MAVDDLANRGPPGDLVDARAHDGSADADELEAGGALGPPGLEPLPALDQDQWHACKRLDVVDDGRLLPEPVRPGKRRLVPRLGALVFDRLEQRRLLAADVAARADEDSRVEREAGAEDVRAEQALAPAGGQLTLEALGLRLVLVAYINDALVGADAAGGQDHPLDHHV